MLKKNIVLLILFFATLPLVKSEESAEKLASERTKVEEKLQEQTNQVVLVVNGLRCQNCAIGIGKKVCKLDFIDTEALPRGVEIDRKNSLLMVSIKENEKIDAPSLTEAIRKAGYDPVRLYQRIEDGSLKITEISDAK